MTQIPVKQISAFDESVRDAIGATLVAGSNVTIAVDDPGNTITISSTPGGGGGSLLAVDTYTAARALTAGQLTGQTLVHVRGRTAANDGAGGIFAVVSGAGTDDGGVVLSVASNTMRLVRQYEGIASAAWWGVLPTSNDVGPALQAAQDWADGFSQKRGIFIPEGFYYIRTPVTIKVPTEGVRPEGSSDGNHGTVFQWVSPSTWPSTVNGRLCDLFEPVFQTEFNNAATLRNISLYGDYGGGGSNKDTYLDGAMFPSLKFFKIPTNGMTGIEVARGVEIINCLCQGFLIGMQARDASHTRIYNCTLASNYVGMWYWCNRGDHAIKDTGLTSHIAGTVAVGEGWTVQMDGNHLGFGTYGLLQIGTPRQDPLRDNRSQWRHWYNNSYTVKKASRFNVGTLSGVYGEYQLGDTVGLFNQDTPSQNGIWIVNSGAWTRDASFTPVKDAVVVVRFSANVGIRETVWQVTTTNPVIGQPITFVEHPIGGVWECLFRNSRFEACGEAAIRTFANSAAGNCEFEFTGSGFDTQISNQVFNLSPAMIAAMGEQTQQYLFRLGVIQSTFLFREDNFTNSGLSPQAGAVRAGNYIHQLNLPANVDLDLRGLGKITFGQFTHQRSEGALLTKIRQSGDNASSLNPYQDMSPTYNPGKLQPGGLYDLLNPAAWNAGGDTVRTLVDASSVDPYPLDMSISVPPNAKAIYFDKTTNPWAWGWRQTATFPAMGQRYGYFWAWVKGRVSLKIRPRNGSGQITEYRGDTRSEISGWQPLQLGNMDFSGATHIEFRIDSENSSSFWIAGAVFSWDNYAPYSETLKPATRDGFQLLNGNFANTIDTTTLTADRTATFPNKNGTVAYLDDLAIKENQLDDYVKGTATITTTGAVTDLRWIHIPTSDLMQRLTINRSFNDNYFGGGSLAVEIQSLNGAWGSMGGGSSIKITKHADFGWTGAFAGATNHLLREVRLVEGTNAELSYSGVWLQVAAGGRSYRIRGAQNTPVEYTTFLPTAGLSTISNYPTPRGIGTIVANAPDYNGPNFGFRAPITLVSPNNTAVPLTVNNSSVLTGPLGYQINAGGVLSGIEAITTSLASPGTGWSFSWARAQVGDLIQIVPTDGSSIARVGRCATAGTVLADTSGWSAGLSIRLQILRVTP